MKYIDAEKLKKAVELISEDRPILTMEGVLYLIDSLQQEQPDFPTTDEQIKEFLATHPKIEVPEKYKNPDWLLKKQEQPEVDLEKEIKNYLATKCAGDDEPSVSEIARHFAEWGADHLRDTTKKVSEDLEEAAEEYAYTNWEDNDYHEGASEGLPFDAIGHTERCFKAGAKWQYQKDRYEFAKLKAKEWMSGYDEGIRKAKEEEK